MSGSHEKLPKFFWVQLVAAAVVGILWLLDPGAGSHGEAEAEVNPIMADALKPIGSIALAKPVAEAGAPRSGESIVETNCKVCHSIGLANAPKLDASAKSDWEARLVGGFDAIVTSAVNGKGGMPPRGGDASLTEDEIASAIQHMLSSAGIEVVQASEAAPKEEAEPAPTKVAEATPAKEVIKTEEAPAKEVAASTENTEAKVDSAAIVATKLGESTYKSSCFACHDNGVANSPKFGDKATWAPRIATGISALHTAAINGKGSMPGKGGNPSLSDEAVMEAVNYMVINAQ